MIMTSMYNPVLVTIVIAGTCLMFLATVIAVIMNMLGKRRVRKARELLQVERSTSNVVLSETENKLITDIDLLKAVVNTIIPEQNDIRKRIMGYFEEGGNHNHVEEICCEDPVTHTRKWWQLRYLVMRDDKKLKVEAILCSIGERKEYEARMAQLETDVMNRVTSNQIYCTLAEAFRQDFSRMKSYSQEYAKLTGNIVTDEHLASKRNTIIEVMTDLDTLVSDYRDYLAYDTGMMKLDIESVSIEQFMSELYDEAKPMVERKGHYFGLVRGRTNLKVRADKDALMKVMLRIIDNAVNFTDYGSIAIGWKSQLNDGKVEIFVEDSGKGIAAGNIGNVYLPGWVEDTHDINSGRGIGLAISRFFVESMGGTLSCTSEKGIGSRFCVVLHLEDL